MNFVYEEMTVDDLWKEYDLIGTQDIRDEIISRNMPFAKMIANVVSKKSDLSICPIEDLICASHVGLIQAFDRFDKDHKFKNSLEEYSGRSTNKRFQAYANLRIKGEVIGEFRRACWHNPKANPAKTHSLVPFSIYDKTGRVAYNIFDKNEHSEMVLINQEKTDIPLKMFFKDCYKELSEEEALVLRCISNGLMSKQIEPIVNKNKNQLAKSKRDIIEKVNKIKSKKELLASTC